MNRRLVLLLLTVTLAGGMARLGGWPGPYWRLWDRTVEDQVQVLLGRRPPPQGVVLVAMPRAAYGQVAERLLEEGPAVVGQIGSPRRMEFTVIGDTVNRAARLESLTRQLGAPGSWIGRRLNGWRNLRSGSARRLGP